MKKKAGRKGKKLHLMPLVIGAYSVLLGMGLVMLGLTGPKEGMMPDAIGKIRFFVGLIMACLGLFGVWDGVRDILKSGGKPKEASRQYILTDMDGKRSSNVDSALLRAQLEGLGEAGENARISLQAVPPFFSPEFGQLVQIAYIYAAAPKLIAFFQSEGGTYAIRQKEADLSQAGRVLDQFLAGSIDFSSWEAAEMEIQPKEVPGRRCLRIFGESWQDEHPFFSLRDLELTMEGLAEGKYQKMELVLERISLRAFLNKEEEPGLVLHLFLWDESSRLHIFERIFTLVQAKFWLFRIFDEGVPIELDGWNEIKKE